MRRLRALLAACAAALTAVVVLPGVSAADCAGPATVATLLELQGRAGGSVFVGEVVLGGAGARLAVDEVWAGPELAPVVTVRTGPEQLPWPLSELAPRRSSVDAELLLGERYVVAARPDFGTDLCSTLPVGGTVLAQAPDDARPPTVDGLTGDRPGLFDTALGASLLVAAAGAVGVGAWGRRLDRRERPGAGVGDGGGADAARADHVAALGDDVAAPADDVAGDRRRGAGRWAVRAGAVGLAGAGLAELATTATRQLFPTDVGIVGFALVVGAPASVLLGAVCGWLDRPRSRTARLALAAVPVLLVGTAQVLVQWAAQ